MSLPKIKSEDLQGKGVTGLPDVPNLNTSEMQEKFDELSLAVLSPKHNALVDALEDETASADLGAIVNDDYDLTLAQTELEKDTATKIQVLFNVILKECAALDISVADLKTLLTGIESVENTVHDEESEIPTGKAIVAYVSHMGGGDMAKATYDRNDDGVADVKMEELTNFDGTPSEGMVPTFNELLNKWVPSGKKLAAQTLSVGATTLTFSDAIIGLSSTIDIYASKYGVAPTDVVVSTGQVELTFDPQAEAISVYLVVK